jgi:hypothetical protein
LGIFSGSNFPDSCSTKSTASLTALSSTLVSMLSK